MYVFLNEWNGMGRGVCLCSEAFWMDMQLNLLNVQSRKLAIISGAFYSCWSILARHTHLHPLKPTGWLVAEAGYLQLADGWT